MICRLPDVQREKCDVDGKGKAERPDQYDSHFTQDGPSTVLIGDVNLAVGPQAAFGLAPRTSNRPYVGKMCSGLLQLAHSVHSDSCSRLSRDTQSDAESGEAGI